MATLLRFTRVILTSAMLLLAFSVGGAQRGGPLPLPPGPQASLMEQARASGTVAVIVELAGSYEREGALSGEQVQAQHAAIAAARGTVLSDLARFNLQPRANSQDWTIPFVALRVTPEALAALQSSRLVAGIYADELFEPMLGSSLPIQDVPQAHTAGYTGTGAVVAVLDTGIDKGHPFLKGQVIAEACFSQNDPAFGGTSICPSGAEKQFGSGAAKPNKCKDVDGCQHGTHVAGIAAGKAGITSFTGVAPGAKIYAIQVFTEFHNFAVCGAPECLLSYLSDQVAALQQVYKDRTLYNIAAVNMSLGSGRHFNYCDATYKAHFKAIEALYDAGVATIIASGNNGFIDSVSSPACISLAITVGSVTDGLAISDFTNANFIVDLWAIGSNVTSSVFNGGYGALNGTSMATPAVTGTWAVLKAIKPDATVDQILGYINATGNPVNDALAGITRDLIEVGDAAAMAAGVGAPPNLLPDAGFEGALTARASAWTQNDTAATVLCDSANANSGQCYARGKNAKGKLIQTLPTTGWLAGDMVTLSGYLSGSKAKNGVVILKIEMVNGKSIKLKLTAKGTFGMTFRTISDVLGKDATGDAKLMIKGTTGGKYYVDDLEINVLP